MIKNWIEDGRRKGFGERVKGLSIGGFTLGGAEDRNGGDGK